MTSTREEVFQDLIAGTISGCCGIVVGHPLDTIKVRLQARGHMYNGLLDCARTTFRNEGLRGFGKGIVPPLVGNVPINALLFAGYEHGVRLLRHYDGKRYEKSDLVPLIHVMLAGSYAGLLQSVAMSPTELMKCQMQTNNKAGKMQGTWSMFKSIYSQHGLTNGIFRGFAATLLRDVPSCGIYFGVYEGVKRQLNKTVGVSGSVPTLMSSICAGGLAGVALWGSIYPLDLVKSKIQSAPMNAPREEISLVSVFKKSYQIGGMRSFTRGFGTTIARALPCNAVTLASYDWLVRHLRGMEVVDDTGKTVLVHNTHHHSEIIYPIYYY